MEYIKRLDKKQLFKTIVSIIKLQKQIQQLELYYKNDLITLLQFENETTLLEAKVIAAANKARIKPSDAFKLVDMVNVNGITARDFKLFSIALNVYILEQQTETKEKETIL